MSQSAGGVHALQRSPSPGSLKRKREHYAAREPAKSARLTNGVAADHLHSAKHHRSPASDELQPADSGDLLHGIGSASSLASTASSVFSYKAQALADPRKASLSNGLTPLTNHTESSPAKGNSPHPPAHMASSNGTLLGTSTHAPHPYNTPEPSTSSLHERPQMLPPRGKAKGYRVVWDPELDNKLGKEERKRATARRKEFGTEVRNTRFHNLLSLYNMTIVT